MGDRYILCFDCDVFSNGLPRNACEECKKQKIEILNKEEKKMIVTIIGSLSKVDEMKEVKEYFERFGHKVNWPGDSEFQKKPLIDIQSDYITKIEEADLIVAIPKSVMLEGNGKSNFVLEFGESTTYEMAIARRFKKKIIFA